MKTLTLKYEYSSSKSEVWGTTLYNDNLIVDSGKDLDDLEQNIKNTLAQFHGLKDVNFNLEPITGII